MLGKRGSQVLDERGIALIGADGIWSNVASRLRRLPPPTFRHRTAWRALVPANAVPEEFVSRWCVCGSVRTRTSSTIRSSPAH